ncbi:MAG: dienelactone hydrolase family protein [Sedimentisphaerales bacterium]|nr:dienelactone hydrolase family protein [Sedimentisphaerales bacterium]
MKTALCSIIVLQMIVAVFFSGCSVSSPESPPVQTGQYEKHFQVTYRQDITFGYLIYVPQEYNDSDAQWPLLVYLHGKGEKGSNLELVKSWGPPKIVENQKDFPFIVLSPQCPEDYIWTGIIEPLNRLLDEVMAGYRVDPRRVYLTGLSMGGFGSWQWGCRNPERFAAIAPVCGGGHADQACRLREVPVWAFHGAKDNVVELERSQEMVDALRACGGDVRITIYPEADHNSWTPAYADPELYQWFLVHTKKPRP